MPKALALIVVVALQTALHADDWPQWLGPKRDGSSEEKVAAWKGPLKVLWKQPVGEGHGSPVVAKGKVYLLTRVKDKNAEELTAFDAETGKPAWSKTYEVAPFKSFFGNGPRSTPAVVDGKVYTFGITGVLTCFDTDGGAQEWQVDTLKEFKAPNLFFGASCSPLVFGDHVFVNVGGKGASIVALDKVKGTTVWTKLDDKASYSSPIAMKFGDVPQVVFLTASGLVSLAPEDGKVYWKYPLVDALAESSTTPVLADDVLIGSSVTFGSLGLKLGGGKGKLTAKEAWKNPELNCYFSTPVAVGKDLLFIVTATNPTAKAKEGLGTSSTLRCIEVQTGKELWNKPKVGKFHASLLRTGDSKLLLLEEAGQLVLLDADPKAYKELARSPICRNTWAHPALSNGRLYVRDDKDLVCVQLGE